MAVELATVEILDPRILSPSKQRHSSSESRGKYIVTLHFSEEYLHRLPNAII